MRLTAITVTLLTFTGTAAAAQTAPVTGAGPHAGVALIGATSTGDFADHVDNAFGLGAHVLYRVGTDGTFGIRLDGSWLLHGLDDTEVELVSPLGGTEEVDLNTSHSMVFLGLGPEISASLGVARPYLGASIGIGYFLTDARADWSEDNLRFLTYVAHEDVVLAYAAQGGVLIPVTSGRWGVSIDVGARYQGSAEAEFVTEENLTVDDGRLVLDPESAEASLWVVRAGVSVALTGS
jgi:hypothetical protein